MISNVLPSAPVFLASPDAGRLSWEVCFAEFFQLSPIMRNAIRRGISALMIQEGAQEVGSSDLNHLIFAAYRSNGGDWQAVLVELVNSL
jgi:hypothetical protein